MRVTVDQTDVERIKKDLRHIRDGLPISLLRAINRTADGIKTDLVTIARREYNVKAAAVRRNIDVRKASKSNLSASTESVGRPIPLVNFYPKPATPQPKRKTPITVEVISGRREDVGGGGFVAVMPLPPDNKTAKKGHRGVFWRAKDSSGKRVPRLPIHELTGPRIEDAYAKEKNTIEIQTKADERMKKELIHQADYLFRQRMGLT